MKKAILFILLIFAPLVLCAQASGPMISFDAETIDYGKVAKGSEGMRIFVFENTGDAPLIIESVRSKNTPRGFTSNWEESLGSY